MAFVDVVGVVLETGAVTVVLTVGFGAVLETEAVVDLGAVLETGTEAEAGGTAAFVAAPAVDAGDVPDGELEPVVREPDDDPPAGVLLVIDAPLDPLPAELVLEVGEPEEPPVASTPVSAVADGEDDTDCAAGEGLPLPAPELLLTTNQISAISATTATAMTSARRRQ